MEKKEEVVDEKVVVMVESEFIKAVKACDREKVIDFLEESNDKNYNLMSKIIVENSKEQTVIEYIISNWCRPAEFLTSLFDRSITCNRKSIDDRDCEITLDYSLFIQSSDKKFQNPSDVIALKPILKSDRTFRASVLEHPLIESFLHIKWVTELRIFYSLFIAMYVLFVACLTWMALTIYTPSTKGFMETAYSVLYFLMICMLMQEVLFIGVTIWTNNLLTSLRKPLWIFNWTSKALWLVVVNTNHSIPNRNWPKAITAGALLCAWMEITVLLSHLPECGNVFHMFSAVVQRALKVFLLFGVFIIIGFSLTFWIMFQGSPSFTTFYETLVKTIVMTSELDYESLIESITTSQYKTFLQIIITVFIFFVPIVMMNLMLALIISDINDLKVKGRIKKIRNDIELIDILDGLKYLVTSCGFIKKSPMDSKWPVFPGKDISHNLKFPIRIQERISKSFIEKKHSCTKKCIIKEDTNKVQCSRSAKNRQKWRDITRHASVVKASGDGDPQTCSSTATTTLTLKSERLE